MTKTLSFALQI